MQTDETARERAVQEIILIGERMDVAKFDALVAALSTARAEGRREGLREAATASYSSPEYVASLDRDGRGYLVPGSPYDRGRYEAAEAIRALSTKEPDNGG